MHTRLLDVGGEYRRITHRAGKKFRRKPALMAKA
jgi:hypothetical protein